MGPYIDFDPDDVHTWLVNLEEGLPLDGQWITRNKLDPVEELYREVKIEPHSLSIWIGVAMLLTLLSIGTVVIAALRKIYKWEPGYERDFDILKITKGTMLYVWHRIRLKEVKMDASNYEEAVDRFGIVRIYESGRRVEEREPFVAYHSHSTLPIEFIDPNNDGNGPTTDPCGTPYILDTFERHLNPSPTQLIKKMRKTGERGIVRNITGSIFRALSRNRDAKTKEENCSERIKEIRAFQSRPLPSVTDQSKSCTYPLKQSDRSHSPFMTTDVFTPNKKNWFHKFGSSSRSTSFKRVEEILLRNSLENITAITRSASPQSMDEVKPYKHKHGMSEIMKKSSAPSARLVRPYNDDIIDEVRSIRSSSMNDAYDMQKKRQNARHHRRSSLGDHITINELYSDIASVVDAPVGTYGTLEKDGYLQIPYNKHPRVSTSEATGDELVKIKEEMPGCEDNVNQYDSIKSRILFPNVGSDMTNPYDSVKPHGFHHGVKTAVETNLYDSIKGILPGSREKSHDTVNKHEYAKVFERKISDGRKRPAPIYRKGKELENDSISQISLSASEAGRSVHKYEEIDYIQSRIAERVDNANKKENVKKNRNEVKTRELQRPPQGIYMKFGEVVFTKF